MIGLQTGEEGGEELRMLYYIITDVILGEEEKPQ